jgi:hypothetical protein
MTRTKGKAEGVAEAAMEKIGSTTGERDQGNGSADQARARSRGASGRPKNSSRLEKAEVSLATKSENAEC